ncbi:low molecular weight protein arginine phosphatase [Ruminiclostridium papyrosolvens]|uniref:Protein tyrosine phosphatase n=1 Tax=Ruminiclostridium papyrosolvens C7 TaxID=1330534 RepID=U4R6L8_9FIRM|nr:low molecular weight protein arginine phosphatase [Ruminiclostridium papyrosolvens]EPR14464.1 protein tyrosine phosphatase [Ruminiclostridium papyrosolvens C7]
MKESNSLADAIKIIFVCTGNTCRSCMAEGLMKEALKDLQDSRRIITASRGISAFDGEPASGHSIKALKSLWDIDISSHQAKMLTNTDAEQADLILTMTRQHRDIIKGLCPQKKTQIFTLKEYVYLDLNPDGSAADISDPYGMPYGVYEACAKELQECIKLLLNKLSFF